MIVTPERFHDPQQFNLYAYTRNNPLRLIDPTGETLTISGDVDEIQKQLRDQLGTDDAAKRVHYDKQTNTITVDLSGIDTTKNEGAALLKDVISSSKVYDIHIGPTVETLGGLLAVTPTVKNPGIAMVNLDNNSDPTQYRTGKTAKNKPPKGVDDQIAIDQQFRDKNVVSDTELKRAVDWTVTFHELAEAYEKVEHNNKYAEAHQGALAEKLVYEISDHT